MVVSWVRISLAWDLDQIVPLSTSQTVQLPLPYSEKPQNLDNTPLTQKKYHTMVIWGGNSAGNTTEILRKYDGKFSG